MDARVGPDGHGPRRSSAQLVGRWTSTPWVDGRGFGHCMFLVNKLFTSWYSLLYRVLTRQGDLGVDGQGVNTFGHVKF